MANPPPEGPSRTEGNSERPKQGSGSWSCRPQLSPASAQQGAEQATPPPRPQPSHLQNGLLGPFPTSPAVITHASEMSSGPRVQWSGLCPRTNRSGTCPTDTTQQPQDDFACLNLGVAVP